MSDETPRPVQLQDVQIPQIQLQARDRSLFLFVALFFTAGLALILLAVLFLALRGGAYATVLLLMLCGLLMSIAAFIGAFKLEKVAEERRKMEVKATLTGGASSDYFERLVNINVENLSAYYVTVKSHANKSFITSLSVGLAGFVIIGIGINRTINDSQHGPSVAILSGVSGVATEFISAVFFYLYNKTVRQMKEYHDSLLAVQNILLSFKLVGDTADPREKTKMIEVMLEYLVGKRTGTDTTNEASTTPAGESAA